MQDKFDRNRLRNQGRVNPPDSVLKKVEAPQVFDLDAEAKKIEGNIDLEHWKQKRIPRPQEKI